MSTPPINLGIITVLNMPFMLTEEHLVARSQGISEAHGQSPGQSGGPDVQNNIDELWTWSINGAKIAGSLAIFTGSIKIVQAIMGYWRDEVLTWWKRIRRRWETLSTGMETDDDEEEHQTSGKDVHNGGSENNKLGKNERGYSHR
jgi:hypothetical protein